jgi:hypothetical protein
MFTDADVAALTRAPIGDMQMAISAIRRAELVAGLIDRSCYLWNCLLAQSGVGRRESEFEIVDGNLCCCQSPRASAMSIVMRASH